MTTLEIVLTVVTVIESGVLLGLLLSHIAAKLGRREAEEAARDFRIGMCESQIKTIFKKVKAIEERIESREADDDDDDDEAEFVTPLSELFGIFSSNSKKDGEVEADEALPEN